MDPLFVSRHESIEGPSLTCQESPNELAVIHAIESAHRVSPDAWTPTGRLRLRAFPRNRRVTTGCDAPFRTVGRRPAQALGKETGMSTFVVSFVGDPPRSFRGRVRHVASGEEAVFTSVTDLLLFFEEMAALPGPQRVEAAPERPESSEGAPDD